MVALAYCSLFVLPPPSRTRTTRLARNDRDESVDPAKESRVDDGQDPRDNERGGRLGRGGAARRQAELAHEEEGTSWASSDCWVAEN
jgi:hypothetical protein